MHARRTEPGCRELEQRCPLVCRLLGAHSNERLNLMLTTLTITDLVTVSGGARVLSRDTSSTNQVDPGHMINLGGEKIRVFDNGNFVRYPGWSGTGDAPRWKSYDRNGKFIDGGDNPPPKSP
jgi:hypothetical protein